MTYLALLVLLLVQAAIPLAIAQSDCSAACAAGVLSTASNKNNVCVKRMQAILGIVADGDFGPNTKQAVAAFQQEHGITADGVVSQGTWTALLQVCKARLPEPCTPTGVSLPEWYGGTPNELACAVKDLSVKYGLSLPQQWAYIMGTVQWETAGSFAPVREGYTAGNTAAETYRRNKSYYPYYGRGYVQLTLGGNYKMYANKLGGNCNLFQTPDLALLPDISLFVTVHGMATGAFTGKKLSTYINSQQVDTYNARNVVNGGHDRADDIAQLASNWNAVYSNLQCAA